MLAVTFPGNSRIAVEEMPLPVPRAGEVLVKTGASVICGSEMKRYYSPEGLDEVPGHEMAGTVVENPGGVGPRVGERVVIHAIAGCGRCGACLAGDRRFCEQGWWIVNGGHAEYFVAPAANCLPLPDDIPFDIGVLLGGDTIGVGYHALARIRVAAGSTVGVVGCGPVGLGFLAVLRFLGLRALAFEVSPYRRDLAARIGADAVIDPLAVDPVAAALELTRGKGVDVAVDASGKDAGVNLALNLLRKQGTFIFAGAGHEATINPWKQFLEKEVVAHGVWYFTHADYFGILDAYRRGLRVDDLITHRFHLQDAPLAYDLFARAQTGKVAFVPEAAPGAASAAAAAQVPVR